MRHLENKSEMAGNPVISIITLNVNSLNNPIKGRDYQAEWKNKNPLYIIYKEICFRLKNNRFKVKGWKDVS